MKKVLGVLCAGAVVTVFAACANAGLVAYYPLNASANDESGNGNDGTVYGATVCMAVLSASEDTILEIHSGLPAA